MRLVRSNTAYTDEALYLWAGRPEWSHWLHGQPIPAFTASFSGAPVIYPPIGALANAVGGLTAARLLSLFFILGATTFLWSVTSRLFNRRAAFFASGLWAVLGPTLRLSVFATYDAMSVFLIAFAAWCVVRAEPRRATTPWMIAAAVLLAAADATAYSSAIFDPVIMALAFWTARPQSRQLARTRAAEVLIYAVALLAAGLTIGGRVYIKGLKQTVLERLVSTDPSPAVAVTSWRFTAAVVAPALVAVLICLMIRTERRHVALLLIFFGAALLVPIEQARIHTLVSLDKHVDLGAWFASVAAGYAVSKVTSAAWLRRGQLAAVAVCAGLLVVPGVVGFGQARVLYAWPNAARFVGALKPLMAGIRGPVLIESPAVPEYYFGTSPPWWHWSSTFSIELPDGRSLSPGVGRNPWFGEYAPLIKRGYFALIALRHNRVLDRPIISQIWRNKNYFAVSEPRYGPDGRYTIWINSSAVTAVAGRRVRAKAFTRELLSIWLPSIHPNRFIYIVGLCFAWSAGRLWSSLCPSCSCGAGGKASRIYEARLRDPSSPHPVGPGSRVDAGGVRHFFCWSSSGTFGTSAPGQASV